MLMKFSFKVSKSLKDYNFLKSYNKLAKRVDFAVGGVAL